MSHVLWGRMGARNAARSLGAARARCERRKFMKSWRLLRAGEDGLRLAERLDLACPKLPSGIYFYLFFNEWWLVVNFSELFGSDSAAPVPILESTHSFLQRLLRSAKSSSWIFKSSLFLLLFLLQKFTKSSNKNTHPNPRRLAIGTSWSRASWRMSKFLSVKSQDLWRSAFSLASCWA